MKIYLCRHGQTTGDIEDRYGGDYDDHLTKEGLGQAELLANKLADKNIEKIFSSPRIRALETSETLKSKLQVEISVLENLRERNHYGILTGMVKKEAVEKFPEEVEKVKSYKTNATDGENYEDFKVRIEKVWNELISSDYQNVGVVSHGGPIRVIFRELLKVGEVKVSDCAYAEILINDGVQKLGLMDGIELEKKSTS